MILVTGNRNSRKSNRFRTAKTWQNSTRYKRKSSNLQEVRKSFQFYTETPNEYFDSIEWIEVDFEDIHSLQNALNGVEEVYHCAAKVSFILKMKKKCIKRILKAQNNFCLLVKILR